MIKILYLFPDTNLLIQCLPLGQLGWERWKSFDEVNLIISRPIQREIDKHKNGGNERLAKRGRKAAALLRDVIAGSTDHEVIRETGPRVKLFVRTDIKPSESLAGMLNYDEPDDQLVGTVHSFISQNRGCDARVLTHDSGPMASAKMVSVLADIIPDEWLLAPEKSESDKRIKSLEAEVARLKQAEPAFEIDCIDMAGSRCDKLEFETIFYEAMSEKDVTGLVVRLKERFPVTTDFGPPKGSEREVKKGIAPFHLNVKEVFTPATSKEIEDYQSKYASWLEECKQILSNLHASLQRAERQPFFAFHVSNNGARPATDALVTISAKGKFLIMPLLHRQSDDDDNENEEKDQKAPNIELPNPPGAPKGSWKAKDPYLFGFDSDLLRSIAAIGTAVPTPNPFKDLWSPRRFDLPTLRDPNEFYYKPVRPKLPVSVFNLECKQWRHGLEPTLFVGQVHVDGDADTVSGALECRIHAGNASKPTTTLVPVQIKTTRVESFVRARDLVERISSPIGNWVNLSRQR
jgi:hypothetical protein